MHLVKLGIQATLSSVFACSADPAFSHPTDLDKFAHLGPLLIHPVYAASYRLKNG